jgi:hypothetical protein
MPASFSNLLTVGSEDARVLVLEDGTIHMSYTVPIRNMGVNLMGCTELILSKETKMLTLKKKPYFLISNPCLKH